MKARQEYGSGLLDKVLGIVVHGPRPRDSTLLPTASVLFILVRQVYDRCVGFFFLDFGFPCWVSL